MSALYWIERVLATLLNPIFLFAGWVAKSDVRFFLLLALALVAFVLALANT